MNKVKIKSIYTQIKNLREQFENDTGWYDADLIRGTYHPLIDELSEALGENCDKFKLPNSAYKVMNAGIRGGTPIYDRLSTLTRVSMAVGYLEDLLDLHNERNINTINGITIINQNTLAVDIKFTIKQLIEKAQGVEEKEKLSELEEELNKPDKNWDNIKKVLIWILNFSKELFLQVVPELLKRM